MPLQISTPDPDFIMDVVVAILERGHAARVQMAILLAIGIMIVGGIGVVVVDVLVVVKVAIPVTHAQAHACCSNALACPVPDSDPNL